MNFLSHLVELAEPVEQPPEQVMLAVLMKTIGDLWDLIDAGLIPLETAHEKLMGMAQQLGVTMNEADLYDLVLYVQFRRTGTPPITIH